MPTHQRQDQSTFSSCRPDTAAAGALTNFSRMPDYELDLSAAERYPSIGITNGWKYTPVTFTAGSKVGAEL